MELLLLLTALLASLTGTGSGDRGLAQAQGIAVVRAAETAQVAVSPARRAIPAVAVQPLPAPVRSIAPPLVNEVRAERPSRFERRLE